uniref:Thioredoxin-like fold domain-containing protein n=1 Tax=Heliothis virescens TaxID=7102 RepID=A0A2A4K8B5_HELVI
MDKKKKKRYREEPITFTAFNWLKDAKLYNHNYERVTSAWLTDNVDTIVLYFSIRNADRPDNIIYQFYEMYENARYMNLPVEVINVPMDETKENMCIGYDEQANWFTLMYNDPLIITLQYIYAIGSVPHLVVIRTDCSLVSQHGILDVDAYGMNAFITWLSTSASSTTPKRLSKELKKYGPKWKYLTAGVGKTAKPDYRRKFSVVQKVDETTSIGLSIRTSDPEQMPLGLP